MLFRHNLFNEFDPKLKKDWEYLEKNNKSSVFSTFLIHKKIHIINKTDPYLYIIYETENNKPIVIFPLEKINSNLGKVFRIHGSNFLDYFNIIYDLNINLNSLSQYILENIIRNNLFFIQSCPESNKLIQSIYKKTNSKFKWISNNRYWINNNKYEQFFEKHNRLRKRYNRAIRKNQLEFKEEGLNKEDRSIIINDHLKYKSSQFSRTFTRNIFKDKSFMRFFNDVFLIKNNLSSIMTLNSRENINEAIVLGLRSNSDFCYYQPSFMEKSKIESPGKTLMYFSIIKSFNEKLNYDFSTGDEPYKKIYATDKEKCISFLISNSYFINPIFLLRFYIISNLKTRVLLKKVLRQFYKFKSFFNKTSII